MASIKVKLRLSSVAGKEGTIYYQIIHERGVRQLLSEHKLFPSEWDMKRSSVATQHDNDERGASVMAIRERIRWDVERITKISRQLDAEASPIQWTTSWKNTTATPTNTPSSTSWKA